MPRREMGLMGYVGEAVISHWLKKCYRAPEFEVLMEIRPAEIAAKGGPYLDLAVVRRGFVELVFEVKSQHYIWGKDSEVNIALDFMWKRRGQVVEFVLLDDDRTFPGTAETEAYLILLVPPNAEGIKAIGEANLQNVLLFDEVWGVLGAEPVSEETIRGELRDDISKVLEILRHPTHGRTLREPFLNARGLVPSVLRSGG